MRFARTNRRILAHHRANPRLCQFVGSAARASLRPPDRLEPAERFLITRNSSSLCPLVGSSRASSASEKPGWHMIRWCGPGQMKKRGNSSAWDAAIPKFMNPEKPTLVRTPARLHASPKPWARSAMPIAFLVAAPRLTMARKLSAGSRTSTKPVAKRSAKAASTPRRTPGSACACWCPSKKSGSAPQPP